MSTVQPISPRAALGSFGEGTKSGKVEETAVDRLQVLENSIKDADKKIWNVRLKVILLACTVIGLIAAVLWFGCKSLYYKRKLENGHRDSDTISNFFKNEFALSRGYEETLGCLFRRPYKSEIDAAGRITLMALPLLDRGDHYRVEKRKLETGKPELVISMITNEEYSTKTCAGTQVQVKDWSERDIEFLHLPTVDWQPVKVADITAAVKKMKITIDEGGNVTVHCKSGVGRSAMVVVAYISVHGIPGENGIDLGNDHEKSAKEAYDRVFASRKISLTPKKLAGIVKWRATYQR